MSDEIIRGPKPAGERKLNYIKGISVHQAKHFFTYHFGKFFYQIKRNNEEWRYDVYLIKEINSGNETILLKDCFDLDEFREYWGNGYHLIIVDIKIEEED